MIEPPAHHEHPRNCREADRRDQRREPDDVTPDPHSRRGMLRHGEAGHATVVVLDDMPVVAQQVDMAEDLRQRQVGLRHGDVAPHRLRQLVRGARLVGDEPEQLARPALVQPEALLDQRGVLVDLLAVPGSTRTTSISRVLASESR